MEERKHIVILAAGDFPTHEIPFKAFREADFVVVCDNAYNEIKDKGLWPKDFVVIGDGDSLSEADKASLGERWIQVNEQDYNDLHKAMVYATSHFPINGNHFTILGATGKREDHTLGNISYLTTFSNEYPGIDLEMLTDYGRFTACFGRRDFASFPLQQVSIISLTPDVPVSTTRLHWAVNKRCLRIWWEGTLNSALSDSFTVEGGTLVVFQTYEAKPL
ncbi:MAG: thiamine diphosphokinase [Bacteroidales bacterium]|nr:thiamine diphosphokinase [Bacteroidales bacterium]